MSDVHPRSAGSGSVRVLDALVRVLVRDGLAGVSVRRVATEAGLSIGAVQHHFATRDALLAAAMDHVSAAFAAGLTALRADDDPDPATALRQVCGLLANVDDDATPSVVWLWFAAQATTGGEIAGKHAREWAEVESLLHDLVAAAHPQADADVEAASLLALLDGLATARASEPGRMSGERAAQVLDHHLRRLP